MHFLRDGMWPAYVSRLECGGRAHSAMEGRNSGTVIFIQSFKCAIIMLRVH